jgi:hypothetical protein
MIAFLKRPWLFGFPVYAWAGGAAAVLIAGVIFMRNRGAPSSTNVMANVANQKPVGLGAPVYPYSSGSSGGPSSPPAPPAATGGVNPVIPGVTGGNYIVTPSLTGNTDQFGLPLPAQPNAFSGGGQLPNTNPGGYTLGSGGVIANPTAVQTQGTVLGGAPSRFGGYYGGSTLPAGVPRPPGPTLPPGFGLPGYGG